MMLEAVADTLWRRRTEGWLVGGTVRDREWGFRSPDLDVVVADDPAAVAREIAGRLASPWFALSARHGAYRVMGGQGHVDVAGLRGADIVDDLAQRDFTINAMAVPVGIDGLIDPFDGRTHLREKRLVAVSERIFGDDPLRLMRAVRFCHVLNLRLDPPLEALLRSQASELVRAAPERVAVEMALTLARSPSAAAFRLWDGLGLLGFILPEVTSSWDEGGYGQAGNHDGFESATRLPTGPATVGAVLERLDHALAHLPIWFPESVAVVSERLAGPVDGAWTRPVALRLAVMMHHLSPARALAAGRRLRSSAAMLSLLRKLSEAFQEGRCSREALQRAALSPRSAVLFLWDSAPWEPESILLAACAGALPAGATTSDHIDRSGTPLTAGTIAQADLEPDAADLLPRPGVLDPCQKLMVRWADRSIRPAPASPVDGEMLIRELGLVPGPRLGQILREVRLAWEAEEVTTAGEALSLAEGLLRRL